MNGKAAAADLYLAICITAPAKLLPSRFQLNRVSDFSQIRLNLITSR